MSLVPDTPTPRADHRQTFDLCRELVVRHLRLRYRRSVLGVLWSQLAPLASLAAITVLFTRVVPVGIDDYAVFVLAGLLSWTWFASSITEATESVVEGRDLVRSPGFPRALLPVAAVGAHGLHLVLAVPLLVLATWIDTGRVPVTVLALPLIIVLQALVTLGPALAASAVNVRYRDVRHLVGIGLMPLFWATPVFYGVDRVPAGLVGWYRLNPLVGVVEAFRDVVVVGRWPTPAHLAWPLGFGLLAVLGGHAVFRRRAASFVADL